MRHEEGEGPPCLSDRGEFARPLSRLFRVVQMLVSFASLSVTIDGLQMLLSLDTDPLEHFRGHVVVLFECRIPDLPLPNAGRKSFPLILGSGGELHMFLSPNARFCESVPLFIVGGHHVGDSRDMAWSRKKEPLRDCEHCFIWCAAWPQTSQEEAQSSGSQPSLDFKF